jgi:hypothetical protein
MPTRRQAAVWIVLAVLVILVVTGLLYAWAPARSTPG